MATLRFKGVVRAGVGKFSKQLTLPGRSDISKPIRDWPESLQPGTLNVRVEGGFPAEFVERFGSADIRLLDSRRFVPEAELNWTEIGGNTLLPLANRPDRGNAQVWRATLCNVATGAACKCWVLRRIGSSLLIDFELVASERLRDRLALFDGSAIELDIEGDWVDV